MDEWCRRRSLAKGAVLELEQCWELARRWYEGRAARDWRPRSAAEMEAIFRACRLEGEFWQLA